MPTDQNDPWPLVADDLTRFLSRIAEGVSFRVAFEELLCELPLVRAEHLMLITRQGRAAWMPLLRTRRGRALLIGNALSGAGAGLVQAGWEVVLRDDHPERLAFAEARGLGLGLEFAEDAVDLPHADESFDLVVRDGPSAVSAEELARVSSGEVVTIADNRYGYKRSVGVHGEFEVRRPSEYLMSLFSREGRSLRDQMTELERAGLLGLRPHALYPDSRDFTYCVSLGGVGPSLPIGPKERSNALKVIAKRIGLFPLLTPSYALIAHKPNAHLTRPLAERLITEALGGGDEELSHLEHLVATRGNNALILSTGDQPIALHIPMEQRQRAQVKHHLCTLSELRDQFPELPVPRPLGEFMLDGVWCAAEERLGGWTAGQISGDHVRVARMLADVSQHLASLVTRPPQPFTESDLERLVGQRIQRVVSKAVEPETIAALREMEAVARAGLVGATFPLVRSHGDLRAKHVQVNEDGSVLGYLDWGATEAEDLPLFDLLHIIINEHKQEAQLTIGEAWRLLEDKQSGLRAHESETLSAYSTALGLPSVVQRAIERLYPLLVADAAEKNWDYSRPRWIHRQFGI